MPGSMSAYFDHSRCLNIQHWHHIRSLVTAVYAVACHEGSCISGVRIHERFVDKDNRWR